MKNRREFSRTRTRIDVTYYYLRKNLTRSWFQFAKKGVVRDIGGGGLHIESPSMSARMLRKIDEQETFLLVYLSLPGESESISAVCKVRNVRQEEGHVGLGIEYILIDSDSRQDIVRFIEMQRRMMVGKDILEDG